MHAQRVRDAENRVGMQVVKWTVEGAVKEGDFEYSATWG